MTDMTPMATPRPIKTANKPQHVKRSLSSIIFILEYKMNSGVNSIELVSRGAQAFNYSVRGPNR